jgi:ABC-type antimicrobial peptide transport system permease subunit
MRLLSLFAAAAVLLAAIGLYGVLAAAVTQRVREFGVRIAMGATAWDLVTLVLRGGLALSVAGLAAGLLAAPAGARLLTKMLYGVQPIDPLTYTGVGFVVLVVSLLACLIPAWRAGRTDPASALRAE